jgi:predicted TIM-barrel fold metal-dependent hydrolase
MIIDIHGHLGNINLAPFWAADAGKLEEYAKEAGVDYLCVTAARSIMYDVTEGNRELEEALTRTTQLLGYVTVNPLFPESINDLEMIEGNRKFIGVKVHPDYHGYDVRSRIAREFLDEVAERTRLMLFHVSCMPGTGFADSGAIAEFASRHPRTNIVMAHMAGMFQNGIYPYYPNFAGLEKVLNYPLDNIYVDTAHHLMYVYPGVMQRMVDLLGADHIVYGTDVPLQGPMQMRFAIEVIRSLKIPEADKEKILWGNSHRIIENSRGILVSKAGAAGSVKA